MYKIYLGFSLTDEMVAREIADGLVAAEYACQSLRWMTADSEAVSRPEAPIGESYAFVLIHSRLANASRPLLNEARLAAQLGVPMIVFPLEDVALSSDLARLVGDAPRIGDPSASAQSRLGLLRYELDRILFRLAAAPSESAAPSAASPAAPSSAADTWIGPSPSCEIPDVPAGRSPSDTGVFPAIPPVRPPAPPSASQSGPAPATPSPIVPPGRYGEPVDSTDPRASARPASPSRAEWGEPLRAAPPDLIRKLGKALRRATSWRGSSRAEPRLSRLSRPASLGEIERETPDLLRLARPGWLRRLGMAVRGLLHGSRARDAERDVVDCTVFAPPVAPRLDYFLVQVFIHLPDHAEAAAQAAREHDDQAARRGFKSLEVEITRGARLTVHLEMPGLSVGDPVQTLVWRGRPESASFGVLVPAERGPGNVIGRVTVSLDGVPVGHIQFKVEVADARPESPRPIEPTGEVAHRYKTAFISYASQDREEVVKRVQMLSMTRIQYFQDVLNLEPGVRWEKELYRHIDRSDLFLLFWSSSARQSEWVLKEVRYALRRQGGRELAPPKILPVILEGPPVPPPPEELAHLHFNDHHVYFMKS